jgi:hypothetical protein
MQGNELFALKNKHFSLHKSYHGEGPDGKDLFEVKGHFSGSLPFHAQLGVGQPTH